MYQKIMVPLDGSELAECVLPHVKTLTQGQNVREIMFVRVVEPVRRTSDAFYPLNEKQLQEVDEESKKVARNYLDQLVARLNYGKTKINSDVLFGNEAENLIEYAEKNKADLIVIATHGRSGVFRWVWGSIADRILHSAKTPVLMVRAC
jgi:nucleotide-binding universal stress UspA family protein